MKDKAVILAGGKGSRLSPLTHSRPKPNVYMGGNKRLLEYTIDMAVAAGYSTLHMILEHMSEKIEGRYNGSNFNYTINGQGVPIEIKYVKAPKGNVSRGTADGLRIARPHLARGIRVRARTTDEAQTVSFDEYKGGVERFEMKGYVEDYDTVVVLSGDHIANLDISELVRFHKRKGAFATIGLYQMEDVRRIVNELGIVDVDGTTGVVTDFREKPKTAEDVIYKTVNLGIYVFDRSIAEWLDKNGDMLDFGKDVFPALLESSDLKHSIFGHVMNGYWNDVGTLDNYRSTSLQLIDGIPGIDVRSHRVREQENSRIAGSLRHSLIGQGCEVGNGAVVSDSVLCNDITLEENSSVELSILFHNVRVGKDVELKRATVDSDVVIERGARIGEDIIIGKGSTIGSSAVIESGTKIDSGVVVRGHFDKGDISD